jgi:hypothetical protein
MCQTCEVSVLIQFAVSRSGVYLMIEELLQFTLRYCQFITEVETRERCGSYQKMQNLQLNMLWNNII